MQRVSAAVVLVSCMQIPSSLNLSVSLNRLFLLKGDGRPCVLKVAILKSWSSSSSSPGLLTIKDISLQPLPYQGRGPIKPSGEKTGKKNKIMNEIERKNRNKEKILERKINKIVKKSNDSGLGHDLFLLQNWKNNTDIYILIQIKAFSCQKHCYQ